LGHPLSRHFPVIPGFKLTHYQASRNLDFPQRFCLDGAQFFTGASSMADEPDAFRKGLSIAARIGVELVAALIVGGGLGYLADLYFSSSPLGIVIGVFLGMSAGLLNVYRTASRL
jgi:ATP synthase protein I